MPLDAKCPKCGHTFPVAEARGAFTITCPRCESSLTAEFKKPATTPEAGQPPYELRVTPGAAADASVAAPRPRRRQSNDEEQRSGGSAMVVLLSGGLGLLVVMSGLALTAWFLFTQINTEDDRTVRRSNNNAGSTRNPGTIRPNDNKNKLPGFPNNNPKPPGFPNNNPKPPGFPNNNPKPPGFPNNNPKPPVDIPRPPAPEKKDRFDLKPVAGQLTPIQPPANLTAKTPKTILLPGRADAVALGGGGRYIVFHFAAGRLAVFDVNMGDIVKEAAVDTGNSLLAAGANVMVMMSRTGRNRFRTYSLPDLKPGKDFEIPLFHGPRSITMGAATNGPLLAVDPFGEVALMDVDSGKEIAGARVRLQNFPNSQVRASHDGKLFLSGNGYSPNDKFSLLSESLQRWQVKSPDITAAYIDPDGKRIYGMDQIVSASGNVVADKPEGLTHAWFVPAATPGSDYFLRVNEISSGKPPRRRNVISVSLHKGNDAIKPVLPAGVGLPECEGLLGFAARTEPLDRHLFLIPEANLLIILNRDKSRLVIRKLS